MPVSLKEQRIRDPLHNLIEFGTDDLESTLWKVIQTRPFQRLRRIKQLGFSEFVFPGATHTRFAHSIGVFHMARQLIKIIERETNQLIQHKARAAQVAALVHDVGHGMFSHSFEEIGKKLELKMAHHEHVSEKIILESEISDILNDTLGPAFSKSVADIIGRKVPVSLYDTVVSSQFDADRLDYMQRDRLMTGVQSSGVDATWLLANLKLGDVPSGADQERSGSVQTLVLGPKAFHAAENYVLSLFQLYPNVYLHKTTRAAEKVFTHLMMRTFSLARDGNVTKTGLSQRHPIIKFALEPEKLDNALSLDDTVFWGALPMMAEAEDALIMEQALRLRERRLPKCIDIRRRVELDFPVQAGMTDADRKERDAKIQLQCKSIISTLNATIKDRAPDKPPILVDESRRTPYKRFQDSKTPLNQILIQLADGQIADMAHLSSVVSSAATYEVYRVYVSEDDSEGRSMVENIVRTSKRQEAGNGSV